MKTLNLLQNYLRAKGWEVFERPFQLNIVGIRSPTTRPNAFDDAIAVFYKDAQNKWQLHVWPATTDPGTYWLRQPMQPQGTAILAEGNYRDCYGIALHRGQYSAICQIHHPVTVIRDYDRDAVLDFQNGTKTTGMYGINIHRATANGTSQTVDKYSAGCQVFQRSADFSQFMELCRTHQKLHSNYFTYSLIDLRSLKRSGRRKRVKTWAAIGTGLMVAIGALIWKMD